MKWADLPLHPTPRMLRQFAVAWLLFLLAVAAHQYLVRHHPTAAFVLGAAALFFGAPALVRPAWIRWPFVAATLLTFPIGWAVSQVVLGFMFYVVLTPIAWYFRARRRDPLSRRPPADTASCWVPKETPPEPERYLRQY
jgi:hypothetical protein